MPSWRVSKASHIALEVLQCEIEWYSFTLRVDIVYFSLSNRIEPFSYHHMSKLALGLFCLFWPWACLHIDGLNVTTRTFFLIVIIFTVKNKSFDTTC